MPRTNLLYTRGTKYYFRRRIPTDLVNAKAYGEATEIRESLGTSDKREADRLAHFRALELLDEWERKRSELRAKALEEQKIEIDKKSEAALPELRQLLARAYVESAERTLNSLKGDWLPRGDGFFRDLDIGSQAPELPKSKSLEQLGSAYKQHQEDVGAGLAIRLPKIIALATVIAASAAFCARRRSQNAN